MISFKQTHHNSVEANSETSAPKRWRRRVEDEMLRRRYSEWPQNQCNGQWTRGSNRARGNRGSYRFPRWNGEPPDRYRRPPLLDGNYDRRSGRGYRNSLNRNSGLNSKNSTLAHHRNNRTNEIEPKRSDPDVEVKTSFQVNNILSFFGCENPELTENEDTKPLSDFASETTKPITFTSNKDTPPRTVLDSDTKKPIKPNYLQAGIKYDDIFEIAVKVQALLKESLQPVIKPDTREELVSEGETKVVSKLLPIPEFGIPSEYAAVVSASTTNSIHKTHRGSKKRSVSLSSPVNITHHYLEQGHSHTSSKLSKAKDMNTRSHSCEPSVSLAYAPKQIQKLKDLHADVKKSYKFQQFDDYSNHLMKPNLRNKFKSAKAEVMKYKIPKKSQPLKEKTVTKPTEQSPEEKPTEAKMNTKTNVTSRKRHKTSKRRRRTYKQAFNEKLPDIYTKYKLKRCTVDLRRIDDPVSNDNFEDDTNDCTDLYLAIRKRPLGDNLSKDLGPANDLENCLTLNYENEGGQPTVVRLSNSDSAVVDQNAIEDVDNNNSKTDFNFTDSPFAEHSYVHGKRANLQHGTFIMLSRASVTRKPLHTLEVTDTYRLPECMKYPSSVGAESTKESPRSRNACTKSLNTVVKAKLRNEHVQAKLLPPCSTVKVTKSTNISAVSTITVRGSETTAKLPKPCSTVVSNTTKIPAVSTITAIGSETTAMLSKPCSTVKVPNSTKFTAIDSGTTLKEPGNNIVSPKWAKLPESAMHAQGHIAMSMPNLQVINNICNMPPNAQFKTGSISALSTKVPDEPTKVYKEATKAQLIEGSSVESPHLPATSKSFLESSCATSPTASECILTSDSDLSDCRNLQLQILKSGSESDTSPSSSIFDGVNEQWNTPQSENAKLPNTPASASYVPATTSVSEKSPNVANLPHVPPKSTDSSLLLEDTECAEPTQKPACPQVTKDTSVSATGYTVTNIIAPVKQGRGTSEVPCAINTLVQDNQEAPSKRRKISKSSESSLEASSQLNKMTDISISRIQKLIDRLEEDNSTVPGVIKKIHIQENYCFAPILEDIRNDDKALPVPQTALTLAGLPIPQITPTSIGLSVSQTTPTSSSLTSPQMAPTSSDLPVPQMASKSTGLPLPQTEDYYLEYLDLDMLFTNIPKSADQDVHLLQSDNIQSDLLRIFRKHLANEYMYNSEFYAHTKITPCQSHVYSFLNYLMVHKQCAQEFSTLINQYKLTSGDVPVFLQNVCALKEENLCVYLCCLLRLMSSLEVTTMNGYIFMRHVFLRINLLHHINANAFVAAMDKKFRTLEKTRVDILLEKIADYNTKCILYAKHHDLSKHIDDWLIRNLICGDPNVGNTESLWKFSEKNLLSHEQIMLKYSTVPGPVDSMTVTETNEPNTLRSTTWNIPNTVQITERNEPKPVRITSADYLVPKPAEFLYGKSRDKTKPALPILPKPQCSMKVVPIDDLRNSSKLRANQSTPTTSTPVNYPLPLNQPAAVSTRMLQPIDVRHNLELGSRTMAIGGNQSGSLTQSNRNATVHPPMASLPNLRQLGKPTNTPQTLPKAHPQRQKQSNRSGSSWPLNLFTPEQMLRLRHQINDYHQIRSIQRRLNTTSAIHSMKAGNNLRMMVAHRQHANKAVVSSPGIFTNTPITQCSVIQTATPPQRHPAIPIATPPQGPVIPTVPTQSPTGTGQSATGLGTGPATSSISAEIEFHAKKLLASGALAPSMSAEISNWLARFTTEATKTSTEATKTSTDATKTSMGATNTSTEETKTSTGETKASIDLPLTPDEVKRLRDMLKTSCSTISNKLLHSPKKEAIVISDDEDDIKMEV